MELRALQGVGIARQIFQEALNKGRQVLIKGDPDVDGFLAWFIAYDLVSRLSIPFYNFINLDRMHGLTEGESYSNTLILNLDSSLSDSDMQGLVDSGNDVISLDHHEVEVSKQVFTSKTNLEGKGIVINNQFPFEDERYHFWSGTGIVVNCLPQILGLDLSDKELEGFHCLHGITLLSDVREIENSEARAILELCYRTPIADFPYLVKLSEMANFERGAFGDLDSRKYLDRMFIDYYLSPYINASFQLNANTVLMDYIVGNSDVLIRSKAMRASVLDILESHLLEQEFEHLHAILVNLDELPPINSVLGYKYTSFIGLIANRFLNKGKTVLIGARSQGNWVRGSVRGYVNGCDYQNIFSRYFDAKGHKSAFGLLDITSPVNFYDLSDAIGYLEQNYDKSLDNNIRLVSNFLTGLDDLNQIAYENQFLLSNHYVKVKYTGFSWGVYKETGKSKSYTVDGRYVITFDKSRTPANSLIMPSVENGSLSLVLVDK